MKFVARAAAGLFLVAVAAPTASLAEPAHNFGTEYFVNKAQRQATAAPQGNARSRQKQARKLSSRNSAATQRPAAAFAFAGGGNPHWINVARRYKGTNPTNRRSLWCADFMNLVLDRSGMKGTSSSMAKSFASYGTRLPGPKVGAIAVLSRGKNGGHVGIVTSIDENGNPTLLSGNHNNTVAEAKYSRGRIYAYVWPTT